MEWLIAEPDIKVVIDGSCKSGFFVRFIMRALKTGWITDISIFVNFLALI
jgi:hypothetical protein